MTKIFSVLIAMLVGISSVAASQNHLLISRPDLVAKDTITVHVGDRITLGSVLVRSFIRYESADPSRVSVDQNNGELNIIWPTLPGVPAKVCAFGLVPDMRMKSIGNQIGYLFGLSDRVITTRIDFQNPCVAFIVKPKQVL